MIQKGGLLHMFKSFITSALSFSWMAGDAQLHCTTRNNTYTLLSFLKDCCSIFGQISEI